MQERNRRVASSNSNRAARIIFNTELLFEERFTVGYSDNERILRNTYIGTCQIDDNEI